MNPKTTDQPTPTMSPTADQILSLRKIGPPTEPYDIPGIGTVHLRGLTNMEAKRWNDGCERDKEGRVCDPYADAKLLVAAVVDTDGKPIFTEKHLTQIVELGELIVGPMINRVLRLSGMSNEADEDILKNYARVVAGS